jgi:hypothetical protein
MRIAGNIVGLVLLFLGAMWSLQGANVLLGSVMSGQPLWLYIGIATLVAGVGVLWWFNFRSRAR